MTNFKEADHNKKLTEAGEKLAHYHSQADETGDWIFYVDEMYAPECVYTCEYGGTMLVAAHGIDEIKATHYGRDMAHGWEGWTFPYQGIYTASGNRVITHWLNRGPGLREDGSHYETPGVSFMRFDSNLQICEQLDMFDVCHQMLLCDELDAAGLLSAALKENWVLPTKARIAEALKL